MNREVSVQLESWPCIIPFRISSNVWNDFPCVVCEIEQDGVIGRGEALGVYNSGETPESMAAQIQDVAAALANGADRHELQELLPPGGARFAVDSALWDLDAQLSGVSAWQTAGVSANPVETVFTIGLEDTPGQMAAKASAADDLSLFKVKLGNDRPVERIAAIRKARPDSRLVVDANQGWNFAELQEFGPAMHELGVLMIEQPLPRGEDQELEGYKSILPLCSDESCRQSKRSWSHDRLHGRHFPFDGTVARTCAALRICRHRWPAAYQKRPRRRPYLRAWNGVPAARSFLGLINLRVDWRSFAR